MIERGSVRAVILNMGGVVRDSRVAVPVSFKTAFNALGMELQFNNDDIWRLKGLVAFNRIERTISALYSIKQAGEELGDLLRRPDPARAITELENSYPIDRDDLERFVAIYKQALFESGESLKIPPVRNAPEAIKMMRQSGLRIGAFSSAPLPFNERWMRGAGIYDQFDTVHAEATKAKPYAEEIVETCRKLGVKPEETVYVGDTEGDILAGKSAGCMTAAVLTGMGLKATLSSVEPDGIYDDLYALAEALKK